MIFSMTGFSRVERQGELGTLVLELRTVNHRYLDISLRLPEDCRSLEQVLREQIGQKVGRGKVECQLRFQRAADAAGELRVDTQLASQIAHASREVDALLYNPAPISSLEVLRWPGVLHTPPLDIEHLKGDIQSLLAEALEQLVASRQREGDKISALLEDRCNAIEQIVTQMKKLVPEVKGAWEAKLRERLAETKVEVDEARLTQELITMAQKMDVAEELDRLQTHVEEIRRIIANSGPAGRRLDFLMQELNREANTLGSKSIAIESSQASVELKVLIEQMREQVQNIE